MGGTMIEVNLNLGIRLNGRYSWSQLYYFTHTNGKSFSNFLSSSHHTLYPRKNITSRKVSSSQNPKRTILEEAHVCARNQSSCFLTQER